MRPAQVGSRAIPVAGHGAAIREARVAQGTGPPSGTDEFRPDCLLAREKRLGVARCGRALHSDVDQRRPALLKCTNPSTVASPVGAYSHSVEVPANARWLSIAGQVGVRPDGTLAEGFADQHDQIWQNTFAILAAANMGPENIVHLNVYSTDPAGLKFLAIHRKKYLPAGYLPSSTWVVVSGLANPKWLVEMEALAAKTE